MDKKMSAAYKAKERRDGVSLYASGQSLFTLFFLGFFLLLIEGAMGGLELVLDAYQELENSKVFVAYLLIAFLCLELPFALSLSFAQRLGRLPISFKNRKTLEAILVGGFYLLCFYLGYRFLFVEIASVRPRDFAQAPFQMAFEVLERFLKGRGLSQVNAYEGSILTFLFQRRLIIAGSLVLFPFVQSLEKVHTHRRFLGVDLDRLKDYLEAVSFLTDDDDEDDDFY